jgi:tetratricopeptide (TPR) repeat protein
VKRNKGASLATGIAIAVLLVIVGLFTVDNACKRRMAEAARDEAVAQKRLVEKAQEEQRKTALSASERFAKQAARAADYLRWEEAEQRSTDAEAVCPDGPWALYARGRFAQIRKEHEKAVGILGEAVKIPPKNEDIENALEESLAFLKDMEAADKLIAGGGDISDWQLLDKLAELLMARRRWREAEGSFARSLEAMERTTLIPPEQKVYFRSRLRHRLGEAKAWVACEGFFDAIKDLPAEEQAKRVEAKLTEVNGEAIHFQATNIKEGKWVECNLHEQPVKHLAPLKGLKFKSLQVSGRLNAGAVRDLTALEGMPLTELNCNYHIALSTHGHKFAHSFSLSFSAV